MTLEQVKILYTKFNNGKRTIPQFLWYLWCIDLIDLHEIVKFRKEWSQNEI